MAWSKELTRDLLRREADPPFKSRLIWIAVSQRSSFAKIRIALIPAANAPEVIRYLSQNPTAYNTREYLETHGIPSTMPAVDPPEILVRTGRGNSFRGELIVAAG